LIPQLNSNKRCPNCGANILGGTPLQTTKSDSLFEHNKQPLVASDKLDSDTKMIFEKVRVVCPNREKDCS